mmetsp:Transcript_7032/g.23030  ORF Transcript_7032/g.23030 Transcript_7032/m.23030 type:complete len:264 (-) Transcript_7032:31-822(-)
MAAVERVRRVGVDGAGRDVDGDPGGRPSGRSADGDGAGGNDAVGSAGMMHVGMMGVARGVRGVTAAHRGAAPLGHRQAELGRPVARRAPELREARHRDAALRDVCFAEAPRVVDDSERRMAHHRGGAVAVRRHLQEEPEPRLEDRFVHEAVPRPLHPLVRPLRRGPEVLLLLVHRRVSPLVAEPPLHHLVHHFKVGTLAPRTTLTIRLGAELVQGLQRHLHEFRRSGLPSFWASRKKETVLRDPPRRTTHRQTDTQTDRPTDR